MTSTQRSSPIIARSRGHIVCLGFTAIIVGASCIDAIAQSPPSKPPQLYLTKDTVAKKGYIEQGTKSADGKVAFRVCGTSERIIIEQMSLIPTFGTCLGDPPNCLWCAAKIVQINPDGSVQIETLNPQAENRQTRDVSAEDWKKAFQYTPAFFDKRTKAPEVGDFVGGIDTNKPGNSYLIEKSTGTIQQDRNPI